MKKFYFTTAIMAACAALTFASIAPVRAADLFKFSFNTGAVAFAYSDGYWDHSHQWHNWRNAREAREYRAHYAGNYKASKHTREHNNGWRDEDHDGVPNKADRDRDGDGVANNHDKAPDNARRN